MRHLHVNECSWGHIAILILYVRPPVCLVKIRSTLNFKLFPFDQVCFNYNHTSIIGALWDPSCYSILWGHMTGWKVTWQGHFMDKWIIWWTFLSFLNCSYSNRFVINCSCFNRFQLQPNLDLSRTMGTFTLWHTLRSHDRETHDSKTHDLIGTGGSGGEGIGAVPPLPLRRARRSCYRPTPTPWL